MKPLNWPTAFALVFAGLPAFVFATAVVFVYPHIALPLLLGGTAAVWQSRRKARRDALAARADAQHTALAALVAGPLPPLPTVPMRRAVRSIHDAPTVPRLRAVR